MKKLLAMMLALVMVLSLAACGANDTPATEAPTQAPTEAPTEAPAEPPVEDEPVQEDPTEEPAEQVIAEGAATVLNNVWTLFTEDQKFPAMGGDLNSMVDNAPGKLDHTDTANLNYQLLVPMDKASEIDDAASLFNPMMLNHFTAGAFHVTGDAKAFADVMYEAVNNNQWMCGFPEQVTIAVVDGEYVVMVFGLAEFVGNFATHMATAYPEAEVLYNEPIAV